MKLSKPFSVLFLFFVITAITNAQITSAGSGNWSDGATWAGGVVPTLNEDIVIAAGHTVAVNINNAECKTITFGDDAAKLSLSTAASILNIYGDFTPFSVSHIPFTDWEDGAVLKFKGNAEVQTIGNLANSNTSLTMAFFKSIAVDKSAGKVTFGSVSDAKLNISNSLEIINGTFEVPSGYDINGRSFDGSDAKPNITIQAGGIFNMVGGGSQIRSGINTAIDSSKIGTLTVYGTANIRTTSGNRTNIGNINVETGGLLLAASFNASIPGLFNAGTVTIKSGAELRVTTGTNFWEPTTSQVILEDGGVYRLNIAAPTTAFPPVFVNNGTVHYGRTGDQVIRDIDYHNLVISSTGNKTWDLSKPGIIANNLEVNDASLILTASSPQAVTINGLLSFSENAGLITTNANTLILGPSASISGEQSGRYVVGNLTTTRSVGTSASTMGNIGVEIAAGPDDIGNVTVTRVSGADGIVTNPDEAIKKSIARNWRIISANPPTNGRNITFNWISDDDNNKQLSGGTVWKSTDNSLSWLQIGSGDYSARTVTLNSETSFGDYTISDASNALPVELISFEALVQKNSVKLKWSTASEKNNAGFDIERSSDGKNFEKISFVPGKGTTTERQNYSFSDNQVNNSKYSYKLKQIDFDGSFSYSKVVEVNGSLPDKFEMLQNYPNPFNPATSIKFELPVDANVRISIYNAIGQELKVLTDNDLTMGRHQITFNASEFSSGIYLYTIKASGLDGSSFIKTMKMTLLK